MHPASPRLPRVLFLSALSALWLVSEASAAKPAKSEMRKAEREANADDPDAKAAKREEKANAKPDRANPGEAESRQLAKLRERLDVTDDADWAVIADRIAKVEELRRPAAGGNARAVAAPAAGEKNKRNARAGGAAELEALRSAVTDQYPDAEIKARLARAHEAYLQREAQLTKAQIDLRSVLSVRQEAIVVMAGLLPP